MDKETIALTILSHSGMAKSLYLEAVNCAGEGKFEEARAKLDEGKQTFLNGHKAHADILTEFAKNPDVNVDLLMVHAEDQMASAELMQQMAYQMIVMYERIYNLKADGKE